MDLKEIVAEMGRMAAAEAAIGGFYRECAKALPADATFWDGLADQERVHASHLLEMARLVNAAGGNGYSVHRGFPPAALKTFHAGVEDNLQKVRDRVLADEQLYFVSLEMERALIEARFYELLKTDDAAYNGLLKQIAEETRDHQATLERKVKELRTGG